MSCLILPLLPIETALDRFYVEAARGAIALLSSNAWPLEDEDRFMLAVLLTLRPIEEDLLERGKQVRVEDLRNAFMLAVHLVARCDEGLAVRAGALGRLAYHKREWDEVLAQRVGRWLKAFDTLPARAHGLAFDELDLRRMFLSDMREQLARDRLAPASELLAALAQATSDAANRAGREVEEGEMTDAAIAANFTLALDKQGPIEKLVFVSREGVLRLGFRQVRDALREPGNRRHLSLDAPVDGGSELDLVDACAANERDAERDRLESEDELLAVERALEDYRVRRLAEVVPGQAAAVVLEVLRALLTEETSLDELAARSGVPYKTLWAALDKECKRLRSDSTLTRLDIAIGSPSNH